MKLVEVLEGCGAYSLLEPVSCRMRRLRYAGRLARHMLELRVV